MSKPRKYSSPALNRIKARVSQEQRANVKKRMQLALKIDEARKAKGLSRSELASAMGSNNPSEATKWLSGTHNFTIETLFKLEAILESKFVNCEAFNDNLRVEFVLSAENRGQHMDIRNVIRVFSGESITQIANIPAYA